MLYQKKVIDKIILLRETCSYYKNVFIPLIAASTVKIEDVYISNRLNDSISVSNFVSPYTQAKFLPYLEYHIADHCNLNCHGCGHSSSLVREPVFPILSKFIKDLEQLHKFIDDFGKIRIMGGEPLLNPEINEYVKLTRRLYPFTDIRVVTNAILLPKMPKEFFNTLRDCNVVVDITFYPPMKSKMSDIQNLLRENGVRVDVSTMPKEEFFKRGIINPHSHLRETFIDCMSGFPCNFLYDGKISACGAPVSNKYFNEYFNQNFPTDGALDLYDESVTTEKIIRHLLKPIRACAHCGTVQNFKWRPAKHPIALSDWVVDYPVDN